MTTTHKFPIQLYYLLRALNALIKEANEARTETLRQADGMREVGEDIGRCLVRSLDKLQIDTEITMYILV